MRSIDRQFYESPAWRKVRKAYATSVGGLCERCRACDRITPGYIVHHKKPLTPDSVNDPEIAYGWSNLQLLCIECHNTVHGKDNEPSKVVFDADGNCIAAYTPPVCGENFSHDTTASESRTIHGTSHSPPYPKEVIFMETVAKHRIEKEKNRIARKYSKIPKDRRAVADGLIERAAFMRVQLEDMELDLLENGWTELFSQSEKQEPYDRARPIGQFYNSVNGSYQKIIKQLTELLPASEEQKTTVDEFAAFVVGRHD